MNVLICELNYDLIFLVSFILVCFLQNAYLH